MLKLACAVLLAAAVTGAPVDSLDGTELVWTFLIHRHGDRTPIEGMAAMSNQPALLTEVSEQIGFGQLTDAGKRRGFQLGKSLRDRYNDYISPRFNRSEIYVRSTDSTRAKMTVLSALAGLFPPLDGAWSEDLGWTPIPYTTVPPLYDFNLASFNCPTLMNSQKNTLDAGALGDQYDDFLAFLSEKTGFDITQDPFLALNLYDVYSSQLSLGIPIDPEIQAAWSELEAAAGLVYELFTGKENEIPFQSGVLLNEFFKAASGIISGSDTQNVRIYSAHDGNVLSFEAATKITNRQGAPKYASAYVLELRKVLETGKYVVTVREEFISLSVEGCGTVCDYEDFVAITSEYALDEATWRTKCGWTRDLVINDTGFA